MKMPIEIGNVRLKNSLVRLARLSLVTILFGGIGLVAANAKGQASKEETPPPFSKEVVAAWTEAGAEFGWMGRGGFGGWIGEFEYLDFGEKKSRFDFPLPAIKLNEWPEKGVSGLPAPQQRFGLCLAVGNMTDDHLKEISHLSNVRYLQIESRFVSAAGMKNLTPLTKIQWLDISDTQLDSVASLAPLSDLRILQLPEHITNDGLATISELKRLQQIDLNSAEVTDAGIKHLAGLNDLIWLGLRFTYVKGETLGELSKLPNLRSLDLHDSELTDKGMEQINQLPHLVGLVLTDTDITPAGVENLSNLNRLEILALPKQAASSAALKSLATRDLRKLGLFGSIVDDEGLQILADVASLRVLVVSNTKITDAGVAHLAKLRNLEKFSASKTQITDKGLESLVGLKNLTALNLGNNSITDQGLDSIVKINSLESLTLSKTKITDAGLQKLAALQKLSFLSVYDSNATKDGERKLGDQLPHWKPY